MSTENGAPVCHAVAVDRVPPRATAPAILNVNVGQRFNIPQATDVSDFSGTTVTVMFRGQRVAQACPPSRIGFAITVILFTSEGARLLLAES
jgi:hypothetical protein